MRLGAYPAVLQEDSLVAEAYQATRGVRTASPPLRGHNSYRDRIAESGLRFSGTSPDGHLVEFVEYDRAVHPFIVGTQAHPELKSRPTRPHPLSSRSSEQPSTTRRPNVCPWNSPPNGPMAPNCPSPHAVADHDFTTVDSETIYVGKIFALRADEVRMPGGGTARREVVEHYGAVGVVALDENDYVRDGLPVPPPSGASAVGAARGTPRHRR